MKQVLMILMIFALVATVTAGSRYKKVKLHPGDELNLGYGVTLLTPSSAHMHLSLRPISKSLGVGVRLTVGTEIGRLIRFSNYSLSADLLLTDPGDSWWYLMLGWRHNASYLSAYTDRQRPVTYYTGPTVGASLDLWLPRWLPRDRITLSGSWWFSKITSALMNPPAPKRMIVTLTYYFI
ncbi:MAG: hypothetical protein ABIJ81_03260 [Patescibacteria group bacterium]